ncbi:MAG: hypothetical protein ACRC33_22280, partial [Gemmataceae bacterium]
MASFHRLMTYLGEAICARGLKTLAECVPLGGALFEIAENACERAREGQLADLLRAEPAEVRAE